MEHRREDSEASVLKVAVREVFGGKRDQLFAPKEYHCCIQNLNAKNETLADSQIKIYNEGETLELLPFFPVCLYRHVLAVFKTDGGPLIATISLTNILITTTDKTSFSIHHPDYEVMFKASSEKNCVGWVRQISHLGSVIPFGDVPQYSAKLLTLSKLKRRVKFKSAVFAQDMFTGGSLRDIIRFILEYTKPNTDSTMVTGLLTFIKQQKAYDILCETFCRVCKRKKSFSDRLKRRYYSFMEQICRCYRYFTAEERGALAELASGILEDDLLDTLRAFAQISESPFEIIEVKPVNVRSQWSNVKIELLDMPTKVIAEQLTLFESKLHKQLDVAELITNQGLTVNGVVAWWNKIANWTSSTILYEPTDKTKLAMVKRFLRVVEHLVKLRNYSTCAQILTGINHHSVSRLRGLQEIPKITRKLQQLGEYISPSNNYSKYRELPKQAPCLRFLAVHQRDIRFICDGNPLYLDTDKKIINFERMNMLGECIHNLGLDYPASSFYYDIHRHDAFQEYLQQIKVVSEDDLFKLSFDYEPSRGGEESVLTFQHNTEQTKSNNPLHQSEKLQELYQADKKYLKSSNTVARKKPLRDKPRLLSSSDGRSRRHSKPSEQFGMIKVTHTSRSMKSSPIGSRLKRTHHRGSTDNKNTLSPIIARLFKAEDMEENDTPPKRRKTISHEIH